MERFASQKLLQAAQKAAKNAYAPYSNYPVGSAVETTDGRIFIGANMENASFGVTSCAEVGALQSATSAGALGQIKRIAVVGGFCGHSPNGETSVITPCGRCRQLLVETALLARRDIDVVCADLKLTCVRTYTVSELMPFAFQSEQLLPAETETAAG